MEPANIENLPDEILIQFFMESDPHEIGKLCQVSTRFRKLCNDKQIWRSKFRRDIPQFIDVVDESYDTSIGEIYLYLLQFRSLNAKEATAIKFINSGRTGLINYLKDNLKGTFVLPLLDATNTLLTQQDNNENIFNVVYLANGKLAHTEFTLLNEIEILTKNVLDVDRNDDKKKNYYPAHIRYAIPYGYIDYIYSLYFSTLYRSDTSINFLDLKETFIQEAGQPANRPELYSNRHMLTMLFDPVDTNARGYANESNREMFLLQTFHIICTIKGKFGIFCHDLFDENLYVQIIKDGDKWKGQEMNKADYWAYKIGDTTLYFKPCGFIVKFMAVNIVNLVYPFVNSETNPERIYTKSDHDDLLEFGNEYYLGQAGISPHSQSIYKAPDWAPNDLNLLKLYDREETWKLLNSRSLLQQPYFFGKFMIPKELIGDSKVIVLGEI